MKLLIDEAGTATARTAWHRAGVKVSSRLLFAEARAALARAVRSGRTTPRRAAPARGLIDDLWNEITRIDATETVVRRAAELCDQHGLRAYDAVHLASCESIDEADVVLVAADGALLAAARTHGVTTLPLRG